MNRNQRPEMAPIAQLLCTIVRQSPGIHFRGLARAANVSSTGQLRHHLDRLGRRGAVIEVEDGRFKRFFVPGDHDAKVRHGLARFARRVPRVIGRLLLQRTMNRTELRRSLGCADSTLGYHLSRMVSMGDLIRTPGPNCCLYSLADAEFVRELLQRHAIAQSHGPEGAAQAPSVAATTAINVAQATAVVAEEAKASAAVPIDPPQPPEPANPFRPLQSDEFTSTDPSAST